MIVSLVDAFIVVFIVLGGVVGYKNGMIKEGTQFIGILVVAIVSFILKDKLMVVMYENLPFFNFFGVIRGISAVNILFYQFLSFLIIFMALTFVLRVLVVVTGLVEWLLRITVFLKYPSKIIGIFVGVLEFYVYVFIALYILNMPMFNLKFVNDSQFGGKILEDTPILSGLVDDTVSAYSDVWDTVRNKGDKKDSEINTVVLATLIDNNLISRESAKKLVDSNKIVIDDYSILEGDDSNLYETFRNKYNIGKKG